MFSITDQTLNRKNLQESLANVYAGANVIFEGWVRNHNEGKKVNSLEYQVYRELALREGEKILAEAKEIFNLHHVISVHREGHLKLGEVAVWVGATASHRDDAFKATRYVIDEIKKRLPIWKKEHYEDQLPQWVYCRDHLHHVHFEENDYYKKQLHITNQSQLKMAHVLVIGAGGLGCPLLVNLASAGVGHIYIVDPDEISLSNIHRQFLFSPHLVGEKKAIVAKNRLKELNPFIHVQSIVEHFRASQLEHITLTIDCTDNMQTKYNIHDACLKMRVPLISAGVFKHEGQLRTIIPGKGCLRCLGNTTPDDTLLGNCNDFGALGAVTSVLGSLQALEAIEFITTGSNASFHETIYLNLKSLSQYKIKNVHHHHCQYCLGNGEVADNSLEVERVGEMKILDIRKLKDSEILKMDFRQKQVVLCCHRGVRSKKMAQELRALGQENVYSLKGGLGELS